MSACCSSPSCAGKVPAAYRRILWVALTINVVMFGVEIGSGLFAGSVSLMADSLDFLGDAANYALSLVVLGMALQWRARASLLKGATMAAFGLWILFETVRHAAAGTVPEAPVMGAVGGLALAANLAVAAMLYRYREGDSNMASVWICSRNDAIANLAVLLAAAGVFGSGTGWPDLAVGAIMAALALYGAGQIIQRALAELRGRPAAPVEMSAE
jgi:Co/Zn/Cd efflux system component